MNISLSKKQILYFALIGLIFSLLCCIYSIFKIVNNNSPTFHMLLFSCSFFCTLGVFYYLMDRDDNRRTTVTKKLVNICELNKMLLIFFYLIIIIIMIILKNSLYTKPYSYYVLITIATIVIGFQIVTKDWSEGKNVWMVLFLQILPLAAIIRGSSLLINPYLIGPDVPWHYHFIQKLINIGYLDTSAFHYYYYPSYHLSQSVSCLILGFTKSNFNLINLCISVVAILIAYLLGKEIFTSHQAGLLCSLLLAISTMPIFVVIFNASKIGGITLLLLCLYLMLKMPQGNNFKRVVIFWIVAVPLFFWHPEVSFALLVLLSANFLVKIVVNKKIQLEASFFLYIIAYVAYLMYKHTSLFNSTVESFVIEKSPGLIQSVHQDPNLGFLIQLFTSYLGISLCVFFVSYIILKWLAKLDYPKLLIISSLMLFFVFVATTTFSGSYGLNPERTLTYITLLMVLMVGGGILKAFVFNDTKHILVFLSGLFIFSFFSISSYLTGDGNNVFNGRISTQTIYTTQANLASYSYLKNIPYDATVVSDYETIRYTTDPIRGFYELPDREIVRFPSLADKGYYVINKPNLERLNWKEQAWGSDLSKKISDSALPYNNGNLQIYMRI